ncbi:DNA polymerase III subunit gamma/tau [Patescibacteria group bacterium]|nr:DNA polymerase III subunit gamma/tau [Patescibacteria group bacterium]
MSNVLYRKYRPQKLADVIGQKHIVQTLFNAIKNNHLGQAYLFTGPRGTGKTSIARILAKTINCLDLQDVQACGKCFNCLTITQGRSLDIIEIDAASHTGVDNVREIIEAVKLPPTSLKFKVYIIDEVHMLSTGAFNALLKTLEEPPAHVIFILATTEIHKVPETIISRCQRFDFTRLPIQSIIQKLSSIAQSEQIKISPESLEMIALASEGGMRDAESLLGQIMALEDKNITVKEVEEILGTTDRQSVGAIAGLILNSETEKAIEKINTLFADGYDLEIFTKALINYFRQLMLLKINPNLKSCFSYEIPQEQLEKMQKLTEQIEVGKIILAINLFLEAQNRLYSFVVPQLALEIATIKATGKFPEFKVAFQPNLPKNNFSEIPIEALTPSPASNSNPLPTPVENTTTPVETSIEASMEYSTEELTVAKVKSVWKKLLEEVRPFNHSLKALLSNCLVFKVAGQEITLATPYDFYKEKLNNPVNRLTVEKVLGNILKSKINLKVLLFKEAGIKPGDPILTIKAVDKTGVQDELLNSALEILGGKVVKE